MAIENSYKIRTKGKNLFLRVVKGHFMKSNGHMNYYIDVTKQKSKLSEALAVADELAPHYNNMVINTILCLDEMQVVATCMAQKLTNSGFMNVNSNQAIYILTPEKISAGRFIFREESIPLISDKNVLILTSSVATGRTTSVAMDAIKYYGGKVVGLASIYSAINECGGVQVCSAFDANDLDGYYCVPPHECPLCKAGHNVDGVVNSYGFSRG
ncbi:MAG: orotate phosphoribosyltransferase [Clostridia bacterium]|nr:orotate phosphoribosyltransferase [Clostridia bacterium]MBQ8690068.1 orotate phosphoribosyltransferase [Clostridia bacterium]